MPAPGPRSSKLPPLATLFGGSVVGAFLSLVEPALGKVLEDPASLEAKAGGGAAMTLASVVASRLANDPDHPVRVEMEAAMRQALGRALYALADGAPDEDGWFPAWWERMAISPEAGLGGLTGLEPDKLWGRYRADSPDPLDAFWPVAEAALVELAHPAKTGPIPIDLATYLRANLPQTLGPLFDEELSSRQKAHNLTQRRFQNRTDDRLELILAILKGKPPRSERLDSATLGDLPAGFRGRDDDIQEIREALGAYRLVTVKGAPGVGKTEVCRETARRMAADGEFAGGAAAVSMRELATAAEAPGQIAALLGLDPQQAKTAALLGRALPAGSLLLLDELEPLLDRDPRATARMLEELSDAGRAKLLVSSQEASEAKGEQVVDLAELAKPEAEALLHEKVAARHGAALDGNGAWDEIWTMLGGNPRALAVAGGNAPSPDLGRLRDLLQAQWRKTLDPKKGQSVILAAEVAWERLQGSEPAAAALWPKLALFPAGVWEEGIEPVFGDGALAAVNELWNRSLVERLPPVGFAEVDHQPKYGLANVLRPFAREQGDAADMAEVAQQALPYLAGLAERYDNELITEGNFEAGVAATAAEMPNLEPFFKWGYEHEVGVARDDNGDLICFSARGTKYQSNYFKMVERILWTRGRFQKALNAATRVQDRFGQANTLQVLGELHHFQDENAKARRAYGRALRLFDQIGDPLGQANTLRALGELHRFHEENAQARKLYCRALRLFDQIGDRLGQANTLRALGELHRFHGENAEARQAYDDALALSDEIADRLGQANTLLALGDLLNGQGEVREAFERWSAAGGLFDEIGERLGQANVMRSIGAALIASEENRERGRAMLEGALAIYRAVGDRSGEANVGIEFAKDAERHGDLRAAIGYLEPVVEFVAGLGHPLEKEHRARIEAWRRALGEA